MCSPLPDKRREIASTNSMEKAMTKKLTTNAQNSQPAPPGGADSGLVHAWTWIAPGGGGYSIFFDNKSSFRWIAARRHRELFIREGGLMMIGRHFFVDPPKFLATLRKVGAEHARVQGERRGQALNARRERAREAEPA
jgi:hypothetical protein